MDDKELDKKIEEMKSASDSLKKEMEQWEKLYGQMGLSGTELKKKLVQLGTTTDEARKLFKKSADSLADDILKLDKQFKNQTITAKDLEEELEQLRRQVNNTADQGKKAALQNAKSHLEEAAARNKATDLFKTSMGELSGTVVKGLVGSFTGAAKSLLGGSDGFQVAATFMTSQIDMANQASQVGSKALTDFGSATAGAGGKLGKMGIAASVAGTAISMLSSGVSELAKAGIQFMLAQTQKTISSFQTMNASGATFAGGMEEMRRTASTAGLTLEQLSKVSSAMAGRMADGGMTVTDATKQIAATGKAMKDSGIQKNLLNLGYSFEQQAEMSAKVAADMNRGVSPAQRASAQEVAAQTEKYATNLKTLSNLTGENAAAMAEKVRGENAELAFEAEKAKMSKEQRAALETAMAGMTEQERKNLRERMVFGNVINKAGAIQEATVDGQREKGEKFADLLKKNNLTTETVIDANAQYADRIGASTLQNADTIGKAGMALGGEYADMAKNQAESLKQSRQFSKENVDQTKKDLAAQKKGKGSEAVTDAQQKSQQLMIDTENIATDNLDKFAKAVSATTDAMKESIKGLAELGVGAGSSSPFMTALTGIGSAALQIAPLALQMKGGAGAAAAAGAGGGGFLSGVKGMLSSGGAAVAESGGGMLKGAGKFLGKAGGPIGALLGVGMAASDYSDISKQESAGKISAADATKAKGGVVGEAGGGIAGGLAGAAAGAAIGSVVPVIGTAIGGIVGGLIGGFGGGKLGKMGGEAVGGMMVDKPSGATVSPRTPELKQSIANRQQELANLNGADKMEAIKAQIMGTGGSKGEDHMAKMVDLMKNQNDMMAQTQSKYEEMIKTMGEHKDVTQRLMNNMA